MADRRQWPAIGLLVLAALCTQCRPAVAGADPPPSLRWEREGEIVLSIWWEVETAPTSKRSTPGDRRQFDSWRVGQRLGRMKIDLPWRDRKGQTIAPGQYSLRYGAQPFSKNHVGTTASRDFLVLVPRRDDSTRSVLDERILWELSRLASKTSHPAVLEIRRPTSDSQLASPDEVLVMTTIAGQEVALVLKAPAASGGF